MNSKETTIAGLFAFGALLLGALAAQFDSDPKTIADWNEVVAGVAILVGFLRARDNNKSSEEVGAK